MFVCLEEKKRDSGGLRKRATKEETGSGPDDPLARTLRGKRGGGGGIRGERLISDTGEETHYH